MTIKTIARAIKRKKPAVIRENGSPRFVVLDWDTYNMYQEAKEDLDDTARFIEALADPQNKKRTPLAQIKKKFNLP